MIFNLKAAEEYVQALDLKGTPRIELPVPLSLNGTTEAVFNSAKDQARLVGSTLFSFTQGVDASVRESISDSALLAQLVANKNASAETDPLKWFNVYSGVLQHVGWTLQESGWTDHTATGSAIDVHEKILEVITVALGPGAAAMAIVTAAVTALKGMKEDSPWITLFNREVQRARVARFQVGLVETDPAGQVFVGLLSVLIKADHNITQVLFFKVRNSSASFEAASAKVSINRQALADLGPTIRGRVRAWQFEYVSGILDLKPKG